MKTENLHSDPIVKVYRAGAFTAVGFVGFSALSFALWSLSCLGSACVNVLLRLI